MKGSEYKEKLRELYYAFCALCDDVSPTNGYRYSKDRVVKFYNTASYCVDCIQRIMDNIKPSYSYSPVDKDTIEKYSSRLKSLTEEWSVLKEYSKKVLPGDIYF